MNTTCGIDLELYKIKESLLKGINPLRQIKDKIEELSSEEIYNILLSTDNIVTSELVYGKDLKIDNRLLDNDGKVSRYVFIDTKILAFIKKVYIPVILVTISSLSSYFIFSGKLRKIKHGL